MSINKSNDRVIVPVIIGISIVVPAVVALLIFFTSENSEAREAVSFLPTLNAIINSAVTILLVLGLVFIRKKNIPAHRSAMVSAFVLSALFLISYIIYHYTAQHVVFGGEGAVKGIYLFILFTHIILSVAIVPLALFSIYRGWNGQIEKHKKVVRFAWPIWLYVSVTGVLVYLMAHVFYV